MYAPPPPPNWLCMVCLAAAVAACVAAACTCSFLITPLANSDWALARDIPELRYSLWICTQRFWLTVQKSLESFCFVFFSYRDKAVCITEGGNGITESDNQHQDPSDNASS